MGKYDDIINLPHYESPRRQRMPKENRAAQFAPFAALAGHEDAVCEMARLTEPRIELSDEMKMNIDRELKEALALGKQLEITYFIADSTKKGGRFETVKGVISKYEEYERVLILDTGSRIPVEDIVEVSPLNL